MTAVRGLHNGDVWMSLGEGSERAQCECGWEGPKRTIVGGLAHLDLILHFDEADAGKLTAHDFAKEVARRG